jgi:hypothetical protein
MHFACIFAQTKRTFPMRLRRHLAARQLPTELASNDMVVTHVNHTKTKFVEATNAYNAYANL